MRIYRKTEAGKPLRRSCPRRTWFGRAPSRRICSLEERLRSSLGMTSTLGARARISSCPRSDVRMDGMPAILEMQDVEKSYPGVKALQGVTLTVGKGEVHA